MNANLPIAYLFLALSIVNLIVGITLLFAKKKHKIWWFAGFMLIAVLLLQICLNVAYPYDFDSETSSLNKTITFAEWFTRVISYTFQSFSLDAGYLQIIHIGEQAFSGAGLVIFNIMACTMTFIAPTTGGFAVFGVLCHFFPYLKLLLFSHKRTKYIFSELNEYSIETAESIYNKIKSGKNKSGYNDKDWKWLKSSVIIFTDAYTDEEHEYSSELLERAKNIGAICLKSDIAELNLFWLFRVKNKKAVYFLMDKNEEQSLKAAVSILSYDKNKWAAKRKLSLKAHRLEMYAFIQNSEANKIISDAHKKLMNDGEEGKYEITFKTINEYRNLVYNLIDEKCYPLYHSYVKSELRDTKLESISVLILGGGRIGKEFFKATYCCGQMLTSTEIRDDYKPSNESILPYTNVKLKITVMSEDAEEAERKFRFEMPEVFNERYKNYFNYDFLKCSYAMSADGKTEKKAKEFEQLFLEKCAGVDYVLVAMGNDDLNIKAAHWIKFTLDKLNLFNPKSIPINYVIENQNLIKALEATTSTRGSKLNPFGSLSQRYSLENIVMSKLEERAWKIDEAMGYHNEKNMFINDTYGRESSEATVVHFSYKLISFNMNNENKKINNFEKFKGAACWLEHRRWCAYMRITGYRCPTAKEFFYYAFNKSILSENPTHKYEDLKLHPCLIESGAGIADVTAYLEKLNEEDKGKLRKEWEKSTKECADDMTLYEWLNTYVFSNDNSLDALDRLGIFVSVYYNTILGNKVKEFKCTDIKIIEKQYETWKNDIN